MGYISIETTLQGEVIIDASRVLTVRVLTNGNGIDLITGIIETSTHEYQQIRLVGVTNGSITLETQNILNEAIVRAQSSNLVTVNLLAGQEIKEITFPTP